jgi:potassium-transporting ATPase KdpC subunit
MFTVLTRQAAAALRMLVVLSIVLGLGYPMAVWGVAHVPGLAAHAEGSIVTGAGGTSVGSTLIGIDPVPSDPGNDPYFHTRPSASAQDVLGPGDPATSGGSNQGGFSEDLLAAVEQRRSAIAEREGVAPDRVPADAVTASASGVDPHISAEYAALQVPRIARVTGLGEERVRALVAASTHHRPLGALGADGVNVTELNLAVAAARAGGGR